MTEPVFIKRNFLIGFMVVLETLALPLASAALLFAVVRYWNIALGRPALVVILTLVFLVLARPPRNLRSHLSWRPGVTVATALARWVLLLAVLAIIAAATGVAHAYPNGAIAAWTLVTPVVAIALSQWICHLTRRAVIGAISDRKVIFAGYNEASRNIARALASNPTFQLHVEGFFDDRAAERLNLAPEARLLGRLADVAAYTKQHEIDVIYISLPIRHLQRVMDLLDNLRDTTASIYYVPDVFVFDLIQARSSELGGFPVVAMCETPFHGYRSLIKRLIDISVSLGVLTIGAPLLLLIALLTRLSSPGPTFFKQRRYGLDGQEIIVYKFRTMTVSEDGGHVRQASAFDARVTRVGRILRRYSLDELPQFFNVLQGRMSVVGPRPHAVAHNEQYRKLIKGYMVRHKVLPGITGLAQVNGARGETANLQDMERRIQLDLDYLRHWSAMLDLKIVLLTAVKIFKDDKAY